MTSTTRGDGRTPATGAMTLRATAVVGLPVALLAPGPAAACAAPLACFQGRGYTVN